jgi:1,4-alpha-glucan branching enzyme
MEAILHRGLFKVVIEDPSLQGFNEQIKSRFERFQRKKREIQSAEGSLTNFAMGYKKFGLHSTAKGIIYREWAPGAEALYLVIIT